MRGALRKARTALAGLALLAASASAAPAVTGAEARAFLGGRTGKIAYLKGPYALVHFLDFNDSLLVERQVSQDYYCLSPMIHPNGSKVLYEHNGAIWIRDLVENSPARIQVHARAVLRQGQTMEPRWWTDPRDSADYVIWNLGLIDDHAWPPASGGTYMQKLDKTFKPVGGPTLLQPFMMSAGRSKNGLWGGTSHHSTGMYKLQAGRNENAFFDAHNWLDSGALLACNASISPSKDPARQDRMMHLTSGGTTMHGVPYDNHKAVLIRSWGDKGPDFPFWWMGPPGDRCNNDGSGNLFWGAPEWSTDEDYFTATGSREIDPPIDSADLYMARINLAGTSRILRVLKGGSKDFYSHLWVKDGLQPARMRLDKPSLSFAAYAKDTANPPAQAVTVSNAGDGSLPDLKIGPLPRWLKVSVRRVHDDTLRLATTVHRDSLAFGKHSAKVSVTFGAGVDSAAYEVAFVYSDPVLTTLRPVSPRPVLAVGDSLRLSAVALDQTGQPLPAQPALVWSGLDGPAPTPEGFFRADSTPWRAYRMVGKAGSVACTVRVSVARQVLRIDAGAEAGKAAPGWSAESSHAIGGVRGTIPDSVRLAAVPDGAPAAAWRTWRQGASAYAFPALPNGRYAVRLHFAAAQGGPRGGVTARFEGVTLLDAYQLPPAADTASRAADVREMPVTVSDGDGLRIDLTAWTGAAALAALEVWDIGVAPVSLSTPNGGERYRVGDTVTIRWKTDSIITSVGVQVSVDSGAKWLPLTRTRSINLGESDWEAWRWVIPDSLDGRSLVTANAMITVYDYFGSDRDRSDKVFAITGEAISVRPGAATRALLAALPGGRWRLDLTGLPGLHEALVTDTRGRLLRSFPLPGARDHVLSLGQLSPGVYRLTLRGPSLVRTWLLPWWP